MARSRLYPPSVDPGFPVLPPQPAGWTRTTFRELVESVERPINLKPHQTYRLLTAKRNRGGIVPRGELTGREVLTKTQFEVIAGDFVLSRRQIIHGACGVVPDELGGAIVSGEYSVLRTRPRLIPEFLQHYAHTPYFQRTCFHSSHGVDVEKMVFKLDRWLSWPVDVPPLTEQRKIADILACVSQAIAATEAVVERLATLTRAMLAELLARGLPGRHTSFKRTDAGNFPAEWEIEPLETFCRERGRYGANVPKAKFDQALPRYVRITDIDESGNLRTTDKASISLSDASPYKLTVGDVLIARSGATVGKSYVYTAADGPCAHAGYLLRFRPDPTRLSADFLGYILRSGQYWRWVKDAQRTQAQPNINAAEYGAMLVQVPSLNEQQAICTALAAHDARRRAELATLHELRATGSALAHCLLMGQVRLPEVGESAA